MVIQLMLGFFLAYLLALVGTPMAREAALRFGVVDRPDGHLKTHEQPVAYLGGLAVFVAFLLSIGMTFEFDEELLALLLASTIVTMVGLVDDFGALTPKPKVIGQAVAVFVLLKAGVMLQIIFIPWWARVALTVFWLVGMSNAFNLSDIMDGLASGLGVIAGHLSARGGAAQRPHGRGVLHRGADRRPPRFSPLQLPPRGDLPR